MTETKTTTSLNKQRIVLLILRLVFGAVFIFSGLSKAIDPLGGAYKINDYLTAWGLSFPDWVSLTGSILLSAFEFLLGMSILFGIRLKEATIAAILLMCFMTPLTLWIAIVNPVTDCGCFGEMLIIDNWTTFWKNIVLLSMIVAIWFLHHAYRPYVTGLTSWLTVATFFMISVVISTFTLKHLPIIDARPYHIGANIVENMDLKEGEEPDKYETYFIYEQNGVEQRFALMDVPYQDSTWTFVSQHTTLVKKGAQPLIHDFNIITEDDDDITDDVLSAANPIYLIVMYNLEKSNWKYANKIKELETVAAQEGADIMILTASGSEEIAHYRETYGITLPFNFTDAITLKTMIRANPGVILLQEATVLDKWNMRDQKRHLDKLKK